MLLKGAECLRSSLSRAAEKHNEIRSGMFVPFCRQITRDQRSPKVISTVGSVVSHDGRDVMSRVWRSGSNLGIWLFPFGKKVIGDRHSTPMISLW
jgi:hypothetical protein